MAARELFFKGQSFRYYNIIVLSDQKTKLMPFIKLDQQTLLETQDLVCVARQILTMLYEPACVNHIHQILERLKDDICQIIIKNDELSIKFKELSVKQFLNILTDSHQLKYLVQIFKLLLTVKFEQINNSATIGKLSLQIRKQSLEALTKCCSKFGLSQKSMIKFLLFERFDTVNRVILPYTKYSAEENISATLQLIRVQIASSISRQLSQKIKTRKSSFKIKRLIIVNQRNQQFVQTKQICVNQFFQYLTKQTKISLQTIPHNLQRIFISIISPKERASASFDALMKNLHKSKHDQLHFKILVKRYIKLINLQERKLLKQRATQLKIFKQLDLRRCVNKTMKSILDEIQTSNRLVEERYHNLSTLNKYLRSFIQIGYFSKAKQKIQSHSLLQRYFKGFAAQSKHKKMESRRQVLIKKVQKNIKCFLLKRLILKCANLEAYKNMITEEEYLPKLLQQILNKNNRAKPFQKLVFVQIQVLSVRNITGSSIFNHLDIFLTNFLQNMKGDEAIKSLEVTESSLTLVTNKRKTTRGSILKDLPINSSVQQSISTINKENVNGNIASQSKGLDFSVFIDHRRSIFSSGSNSYGSLGCGLNNSGTVSVPHRIPIKEQVRKISCGLKHTICLTCQNSIYVWGCLPNFKDTKVTLNQPQKLNVPSGIMLDVESSNFNSFILFQNKTIIDINNLEVCFKQQHNNLLPYQIVNISSPSFQILLVKKLNFSQTNLSLKDKKEIARSLALRDSNKKDLFTVPFDLKYYTNFSDRTMIRPCSNPKLMDLNESNLLQQPHPFPQNPSLSSYTFFSRHRP